MSCGSDDISYKTPEKKHRRSTDYRKCLKCQKDNELKLSIAKLSSVQKFCDVSEKVDDDIYHRIKTDIESIRKGEKNVVWHADCYKSYTHSGNLKRKMKMSEDQDLAYNVEPALKKTRSGLADKEEFKWNKCMFCKKIYHNKTKKLLQMRTKDGQERIIQEAKHRNDDKLLMEINAVAGDLIAAEAKYHKACRDGYMVSAQDLKKDSENIKSDANHTEDQENIFEKCFQQLVDSIDPDLTYNKKTLHMSSLVQKYEQLLRAYIPDVSYQSKKLKQKLIKHYGEGTLVFQDQLDKTQSQLVYSSKVTLKNVIDTVNRSQLQNAEEIQCPDDNVIPDPAVTLYHAAKIIRQEIKECKGISLNPMNINDIGNDKAREIIPNSIKNILKWVMTSSDDEDDDFVKNTTATDATQERKILSLGQDLIYAATNGNVATPKHVGFAMTMKHKTNSRQMLTLLNHAGHAVSYKQLTNVDRVLEENNKGKSTPQGVIIPSNIIPGAGFIHGAADNVDILEETLDGRETTHATSMVLYQCQGNEVQNNIEVQNVQIPQFQGCDTRTPKPLFKKDADASFLEPETRKTREQYKDLVWMLSRLKSEQLFEGDFEKDIEHQDIPGWTPFNTQLSSKEVCKTTIGYCPLLHTSPTQDDTVYEVMKRMVEMTNTLGQSKAVLTLDLAIYIKAKIIQWNYPQIFENLIVRLGGFHICLNFIGTIGHIYRSSGLEEWVIESNLYGPNTLASILSGKQYNRGVRACKMIIEALFRKKWEACVAWMSENDKMSEEEINDICAKFGEFQSLLLLDDEDASRNANELTDMMEQIEPIISEFSCAMRQASLTYAYWENLISMIEILLQYIRSERESNWKLHLQSVTRMLPYMFVAGHTNYARWTPIYLADMAQLEQYAPDVYQEFMNGKHTVARSQNSFASVWSDMALEQSANCHSKSRTGGVIGITKKEAAHDRWWATVHERGAISDKTCEMFGLGEQVEPHHKEDSKARKKKDETDVQSLSSTLGENIANPFMDGDDNCLVNIATGMVLPSEHAEKLVDAKVIGEDLIKQFIDERLVKKTKDFYSPIQKYKLQSFDSLNKPMVITEGNKKKTVKTQPDLFKRLIIVAQSRKVDLKKILSYELTAVPLSLAHPDGTMNKSVKCQLMHELETFQKGVKEKPSAIGQNVAYIFDAMAVLHTLKQVPKTFGELAVAYFEKACELFELPNVSRVDVVFDMYCDESMSIKAFEHMKRQKENNYEVRILNDNTHVPQGQAYKCYLANTRNKMHLTRFLGRKMVELAKHNLAEGKVMYISFDSDGSRVAAVIKGGNSGKVRSLASQQHEADGCLLLHANHAAASCSQVIIWSPDTDVLVLATHFCPQMNVKVWIKTGTGSNVRFININSLCQKLGPQVVNGIVAFHCLTGCDSTSGFTGKGRGKGEAWKYFVKHVASYEPMSQIGDTIDVDGETETNAAQFVAGLYNKRIQADDLNSLRYKLFTQPGKEKLLPPTNECFHHHFLRSNYTAHLMKSSLDISPIPSPEGNGWHVEQGELKITFSTSQPAPLSLAELICCGCRTGCARTSCSCRKESLSCIASCKCMIDNEECHNPHTLQLEMDSDNSDDSDAE